MRKEIVSKKKTRSTSKKQQGEPRLAKNVQKCFPMGAVEQDHISKAKPVSGNITVRADKGAAVGGVPDRGVEQLFCLFTIQDRRDLRCLFGGWVVQQTSVGSQQIVNVVCLTRIGQIQTGLQLGGVKEDDHKGVRSGVGEIQFYILG